MEIALPRRRWPSTQKIFADEGRQACHAQYAESKQFFSGAQGFQEGPRQACAEGWMSRREWPAPSDP